MDRIAAERTLIVSKALTDALQVLGRAHCFEEWQETATTFLINLAAPPAVDSARITSTSRPEIVVTKIGRESLQRLQNPAHKITTKTIN